MMPWYNTRFISGTLALLLAVFIFATFHTARQRDAEKQMREAIVAKFEDSISRCQPAVVLRKSEQNPNPLPVDSVPLMKYRENTTGHGCVFLPDGRYGDLWWSIVVAKSNETEAHLEWNFNERGHYKW